MLVSHNKHCPRSVKSGLIQSPEAPRPRLIQSALLSDDFRKKIGHFTTAEAIRAVGPIYDVIRDTFYQAGCKRCGKFFECLVAKEKDLFKRDYVLYHVRDDKALLHALVDNVMMAEKTARLKQIGSKRGCLRILYQTLLLLESYFPYYEWLLSDMYKIIVDIAEQPDTIEERCSEIKARIYCHYAIYLGSKGSDSMNDCFKYFTDCLQLCRGEPWPAGTFCGSSEHCTLHEFAALELGRTLVGDAKTVSTSDPRKGMEFAEKAILAIAEVGQKKHKLLLCKCFLLKIGFLLDLNQIDECMKIIGQARKYLPENLDSHFASPICDLYIYEGRCYFAVHDLKKALYKMKQGVLVARKFSLLKNEAQALLQLGKLYERYPGGLLYSNEAFLQAKELFEKLKDRHNILICKYRLAKFVKRSHFSELLDIIKIAKGDFCKFRKLRKWKDRLVPFWKSTMTQSSFNLLEDESLTTMRESVSFIKIQKEEEQISDEEDTDAETNIEQETEVGNEKEFYLDNDDEIENAIETDDDDDNDNDGEIIKRKVTVISPTSRRSTQSTIQSEKSYTSKKSFGAKKSATSIRAAAKDKIHCLLTDN